MKKRNSIFGCLVFDNQKMKERLPKQAYQKWKKANYYKNSLDIDLANIIAEKMKEWALENGCTHYSHWFQPMTGSTAEKHQAFLEKDENNLPILSFTGKELIKGESDASSFPSGGLRATFEARGNTYWDYRSPAFIRGKVLCIPSVFVSATGESLDMKQPLLRSLDVLNEKATQLMNLLGYKDVSEVQAMIGLEQEYFLVDRPLYKKREDLILCGRTLFGNPAPKGQELDDHYYGTIPVRVISFMEDLNEELWKLGIYAKTEHNEVAPGQFELAAIYSDTNLAVDQNQMVMDILKRTAYQHGYACLLHEKPFPSINGSGKHNNYSLITNTGINVFSPGESEMNKLRFFLFVSCLLKAVDTYPELLRLSISNPGNDYRLGANEAPPAIISISIGKRLEEELLSLIKDVKRTKNKRMSIEGYTNLFQDEADRNRTSPLAFTGNKFEFRMLGSSVSASFPNIVLNTILASIIDETIHQLKRSKKSLKVSIKEIISQYYEEHSRILFSGNGYSEAWIQEAKQRGLPNITSCTRAIKLFDLPKNVSLLEKYGIFTKREIEARKLILFEQYNNIRLVEAKTLVDMTNTIILPSLANELIKLKQAHSKAFVSIVNKKEKLYQEIEKANTKTTKDIQYCLKKQTPQEIAETIHDKLRLDMNHLQALITDYEKIVDKASYPLPTATDLLF